MKANEIRVTTYLRMYHHFESISNEGEIECKTGKNILIPCMLKEDGKYVVSYYTVDICQ